MKFLLITMVVMGHFIDMFSSESQICQSIFLLIYSFHMPLFLFISGLFHSDKNIMSKCIYFCGVGILLKILLFVMQQGTEEFLCLSKAIVFYPFYLSGTLIDPERIVSFKKRYKRICIFAAAVFLLWGFLCFTKLDLFYRFRHLFTGRNPFNLQLVPHGALARAFCYIISIVVSLALIILCPNKKIPGISKMGTRTLDVYFWHWSVFLVLDYFLHIKDLWNHGVSGKICYMILSIIVSVGLSQGGPISYPLMKIRNTSYAASSHTDGNPCNAELPQ